MSNYPAIPEPGNDLASIKDTVAALKQVIELFLDVRGLGAHKSTIFITTPTDTVPTGNVKGDLWILKPVKVGDVWMMSIWNGARWEKM